TQADMRAALNSLTPMVTRVQYREAHATETRGYWVYLPATSSREQALAIALGLFRDKGNAEKRRAEVAALGFTPELVTRTEELPVYWVDFATDPQHPF